MHSAALLVLIEHGLMLLFEPLPTLAILSGIGTHASYLWLLQSFPRLRLLAPPTLTSAGMLVLTHVLWMRHFLLHYQQARAVATRRTRAHMSFTPRSPQLTHVLCFCLVNLWLLPFGFFVSLTINESTLPDSLGSSGGSSMFGKSV